MGRGDKSTVAIAKITARQAIIVALISAIATLAAAIGSAFITLKAKPDLVAQVVGPKQHTLTIIGVDPGIPGTDGFRVTAVVNGVGYSFPTQKVWGEWGQQWWEPASWPLANAEQYKIQFLLWLKGPDGTEKGPLGSSMMHEIIAKDLAQPTKRAYASQPFHITYMIE
jgi:hypothetical protein